MMKTNYTEKLWKLMVLYLISLGMFTYAFFWTERIPFEEALSDEGIGQFWRAMVAAVFPVVIPTYLSGRRRRT